MIISSRAVVNASKLMPAAGTLGAVDVEFAADIVRLKIHRQVRHRIYAVAPIIFTAAVRAETRPSIAQFDIKAERNRFSDLNGMSQERPKLRLIQNQNFRVQLANREVACRIVYGM